MIDLLMTQSQWLVVSGAGVSAASGVPTYRNRRGEWQRKPPVTHQEFVASADSRRRFWARNMIGWRFISEAQPNAAHRALVQLEARGVINAVNRGEKTFFDTCNRFHKPTWHKNNHCHKDHA